MLIKYSNHDIKRVESRFLSIIKRFVGRSNAVKGNQLHNHLQNAYIDITKRQMRRLIQGLRNNQIPICSEGGIGYWWPVTPEEVRKCAKREMASRGKTLLYTAAQMEKGIPNVFGPQMGLEI